MAFPACHDSETKKETNKISFEISITSTNSDERIALCSLGEKLSVSCQQKQNILLFLPCGYHRTMSSCKDTFVVFFPFIFKRTKTVRENRYGRAEKKFKQLYLSMMC